MKPKLDNMLSMGVNKFVFVSICIFILYLVVAYLLLDTLSVYDAPGHVLAVEKARAFWPSWHFWSNELLGWLQGSTYPMGVHWLMAGLSLVMGSIMAVKTIIVVSLIVLPFAIWRYIKSIGCRKLVSWIVLVFVLIILMVLPDYIGSSIRSLFNLGLISNFVALPILFYFMTSLENLNHYSKTKELLIAGILLGLLVWMHLVVTIVAVVYMLGIIIDNILHRKLKLLAIYGKVILLGLTISAPFVFQMIILSKEQLGSGGGVQSLIIPNLLVVAVAVICARYFYKSKQFIALRLSIISLIFALVCALDGLLVQFFGTSLIFGWLHVYRFQIFAYLFLLFATARLILIIPNNFFKRFADKIIFASLALLFIILLINNPYNFDYANVSINDNSVKGRFLEGFSRAQSYPSPYYFQSLLARSNKEAIWAYGLFIESSMNSAFVKSLSLSLATKNNDSVDPPIIDLTQSIDEVILSDDRVNSALKLFAINNVIVLDNNYSDSIGIWTRQNQNKFYHIQAVGPYNLVEEPEIHLVPVKSNWEKEISQWWRKDGPIIDLPYDASDQMIPSTKYSYSKVTLIEFSNNKISFDIKSEVPVPVLIKSTYSSEWTAYSDNKKIKIWKAAPYLMIVYARGKVELVNG